MSLEHSNSAAYRRQQRARSEARRHYREQVLTPDANDFRPWRVVPASVRVAGDPVGMSRPSNQCVRLEDGTWQYVAAEESTAT